MKRTALILIVVLGGAALPACGGETSRDDFVAHALEVSTAATTDEAKQTVRDTFGCVYDEIADDEDLVADFMATSAGQDIPDDVSRQISGYMIDCTTVPVQDP